MLGDGRKSCVDIESGCGSIRPEEGNDSDMFREFDGALRGCMVRRHSVLRAEMMHVLGC